MKIFQQANSVQSSLNTGGIDDSEEINKYPEDGQFLEHM
jgi:hypothetical protein